jgi:hypothetical protein
MTDLCGKKRFALFDAEAGWQTRLLDMLSPTGAPSFTTFEAWKDNKARIRPALIQSEVLFEQKDLEIRSSSSYRFRTG